MGRGFARLVEVLGRRWDWLFVAAVLLGALGFLWGHAAGSATATVELATRDLPIREAADSPGSTPPRQSAAPWAAGLARSDLVLRRVAQDMGPDWSAEAIAAQTSVTLTPALELIALRAKSAAAAQAVRLANVYSEQMVAAAQEWLAAQHQATSNQLHHALATVDDALAQASRELVAFQQRTINVGFEGESAASVRLLGELDRKAESLRGQLAACDLQTQSLIREIVRLTPAMIAAKEALAQALMRYTEAHPKVKELRATLDALEAQAVAQGLPDEPALSGWNSAAAVSLYTRVTELKSQKAGLVNELEAVILQRQKLQSQVAELPASQAEHVRLKSRFEALKEQRFVLARRAEEAQTTFATADAGLRLLALATYANVDWSGKWRSGLAWGTVGALAGLCGALLLALAWPDSRWRIRSDRELGRITQLPLLGTLGDLGRMSEEERQQWAFRLFTRLRGQLARSNQEALVCGVTSATPGEGRSTFIRLLADAAGRQGQPVVTISARESRPARPAAEPWPAPAGEASASSDVVLPEFAPSLLPPTMRRREAVLPADWAWDPQHREQWRHALQGWQEMEGLVVLVELPPASHPETALLAEGLPNLVWLCGRDMARASDTRLHLEVLRHAGARLMGCVLNRAGRAVSCALVGLLAGNAFAQQTPPTAPEPVPAVTNAVALTNASVPTNANGSLSIVLPTHLAAWQQRLTLGPGDVFDLSLYEQPDSARPGIIVGPDGRINYLEARDVTVTGLTVDELRTKLEGILGKFHRAPRVVVHPLAYNSKKYYMLGNVNGKGVYALDRPVSLLEAVAKAKGFVTTFPQRTAWIQADLQRSFLIRRQPDGSYGRVPVDFEGLFLQGDLSHNIGLEPDDYLFFPPLELQEVYVLGEVNGPGAMPFSPNLTALGAIVARGGFTQRAYKSKVVVVRGSLSRPQTYVVNVADLWKAKGVDFPLQSRDIVYVHTRPFARVEELAEDAAMSFVRSMATAWANKIFPR